MTEKTLINNEWALGKEIGKGGFGSIFLSANIHNKKLAAIKVEDLRVSELLFIEASILKSLNVGKSFPSITQRGSPGFIGAESSQAMPINIA